MLSIQPTGAPRPFSDCEEDSLSATLQHLEQQGFSKSLLHEGSLYHYMGEALHGAIDKVSRILIDGYSDRLLFVMQVTSACGTIMGYCLIEQ
jgi:hypothetical protein